MNKNVFTGILIACMFFLIITFFSTCSVNRKLKTVNYNNISLQHKLDSLIIIENSKVIPVTLPEIKDEVQTVMFNFLVYESDLDKNKTSLSVIKNKIEEDDKK
jgi:hypothetical protein